MRHRVTESFVLRDEVYARSRIPFREKVTTEQIGYRFSLHMREVSEIETLLTELHPVSHFTLFSLQCVCQNSVVQVTRINSTKEIIALGVLLEKHLFLSDTARVGEIRDIVVKSRYRGNGLGKALVGSLLTTARTRKYPFVETCVSHRSQSLRSFFKGRGFEEADNGTLRHYLKNASRQLLA